MSDEYCGSKWTPEGDTTPWHCTRPAGHGGMHKATEYGVGWTEGMADE